MRSKITIAIDGYSSCGKSTTAKEIAKILNYAYVDTGAMYRAVTLYFLQNHITVTNPREVADAVHKIQITFRRNPESQENEIYLNGLNVAVEIRKMYVSEFVSVVSAIPEVRRALVAQQQQMGKGKGLVMDGRDIGTVVFPDADLKIFMTADPIIRAQRRQAELLEKGEMVNLEKILENLKKRDEIDTTREDSPLKMAEDAVLLDNSMMAFDEQVTFIMELADSKLSAIIKNNQGHEAV
jgi:cytidylate kinase